GARGPARRAQHRVSRDQLRRVRVSARAGGADRARRGARLARDGRRTATRRAVRVRCGDGNAVPEYSRSPVPEDRAMIHASIADTIGRTRVVRLQRVAPRHVELYVKIESFNPGGSVKDRLALAI